MLERIRLTPGLLTKLQMPAAPTASPGRLLDDDLADHGADVYDPQALIDDEDEDRDDDDEDDFEDAAA